MCCRGQPFVYARPDFPSALNRTNIKAGKCIVHSIDLVSHLAGGKPVCAGAIVQQQPGCVSSHTHHASSSSSSSSSWSLLPLPVHAHCLHSTPLTRHHASCVAVCCRPWSLQLPTAWCRPGEDHNNTTQHLATQRCIAAHSHNQVHAHVMFAIKHWQQKLATCSQLSRMIPACTACTFEAACF